MRQTIFTIILIAALAGIGYFAYRFSGSESPPEDQAMVISAERDQRLNEYLQLETLRLDLGIFQDPSFQSLFSPLERAGVGTTTQIKSGRVNPFVPF